MKFLTMLIFTINLLLLTGCVSSTRYVDINNDPSIVTSSIDENDFKQAAAEAVTSMLNSGALNKNEGGRYVLAISTITNDTMQRIDVDMLIKKIRIDLLQSGKVVVTTAVRAGGPEDSMSMQARELRKSEEFNQNTVAAKGQMIAPDLSLSGKIIQRNTSGKGGQRIDYYFQLTLTDINSGLAFWEGETVVAKMTSNNSAAW
ncbi:MAG: penicillin-binding protein activator LpoB [Proteobacteria bacterium]|nr:penicillin-binding protein activator LpoB [Pseudomonadota bacterium]